MNPKLQDQVRLKTECHGFDVNSLNMVKEELPQPWVAHCWQAWSCDHGFVRVCTLPHPEMLIRLHGRADALFKLFFYEKNIWRLSGEVY